jgi:hypothetical protein
MERNNMYKNGIPQFDGHKYSFWSRMMKTYIHGQGFEIWQSVVDGYKEPTIPLTNERAYFLRVDETVNAIIGLAEEIKKSVIVQKVLRSLPMRFDPKISTLEERADLDSISMDELHGIFTTYEMRNKKIHI